MKCFRAVSRVILFFVMVSLSVMQLSAADEVDLKILTEEYPPLNFRENGEITGLVTEVVREIMHRTGRADNISLLDWETGYQLVMEQENVVLFTTVMTAERKDQLQWVGPVTVFYNDIYTWQGSDIQVNSLQDLQTGTIATVKDYHSEQLLAAEGFTNLVSHTTEEEAFAKMLRKEATFFIGNRMAMPALLKTVGANSDDIRKVYDFSINLGYIAFSRETPETIVSSWQQVLDEMKDDGTFNRIYSRWLPADTPPGKLIMMTEEYPPVTFMQDGKPSGFVTDMVREIAARQNIPENIILTYWNNAYNMALLHPNVVLFSADRTPERENLFHWVGPVGLNSSVLYAKKGSGISLNSLDEAKKVKAIATTTDWFNEQYLQSEGFTNLKSAKDPIENIRHLMNDDAQLLIFSDLTIPEIVRNAGYGMEDLEAVFTVSQTYIYIAISQGTPAATVQAWQTILAEMKKDGTFTRIYRSYLPHSDLNGLLE